MFDASDLEVLLLDPQKDLVRLFRYDGAHIHPPEEVFRNARVDPPVGHKSEFSVLYLGQSIATVAVECHILSEDAKGAYRWLRGKANEYKVARYRSGKPALFIPIDGRNRKLLGLEGDDVPYNGYAPFQAVSLELFQRFGNVVHGLTWSSFHRNQPGRVFALWHHHKDSIGLKVTSTEPFSSLAADDGWREFLAKNPAIQEIA
ncbi:hypothetical protein ABQW67_05475 [Xanthomonas hortorum]|uniref:hypothetical protein n=1 Tax=Xanthomonas hortorum TaxID=56454 RepID=UPI0032E8FED7